MKSFAFKMVDNLALLFWGENAASTADFQEALTGLAKNESTRVCVITRGGGPTTIQRAQLTHVAKLRSPRVAIVCESESAALRGVITAYCWFNKDVRDFPAHGLHDALRYLDITAAQFPEVRREIDGLREIVCPPAGTTTRARRHLP